MLSLTTDKQRYTFRYISALGVIALLCIVSFVIMSMAIEKAETDAPDVKISAEQQMLSQRVAFLAHSFFIIKQDSITELRLKKDIFDGIKVMKRNHLELLEGNNHWNYDFFLNEKNEDLSALYYDVDTVCLDDKINVFFREVIQLLNTSVKKDNGTESALNNKKKTRSEKHFSNLNTMASAEFFDALGVLINYSETESRNRLNFLKAMEMCLMGVILLTLLLVGVTLFRPMVNKIISDRNNLINSQRKMTSVLRTVGEGILSVNAQNQVVMANQEVENIWGYTEAELLNNDFHRLLVGGCKEQNSTLQLRYKEEGIKGLLNELFEIEGKRKDGSTFPLEIKITETLVDNEVLFIAAASDVTNRKKAEQALIEAKNNLEKRVKERTRELQRTNMVLKQEIRDRQHAEEGLEQNAKELKRSNSDLEQFAYVASHDLKEPIRMVSSYVQLLEQRYKEHLDTDGITFMNYAVEGAKRANALINDLLEYARINHDNNNFKDVSTKEVLLEVEQNLRIAIRENDALINLPTHLPTIKANRMQMVRLFQNLISNAIKFRREEPPRINIEVSENGKYYLFKVIDNGLGIEPKYKDKIFLIFQRLHSRNEYQGTGLGLAVCKKIVQHHEGRFF